MNKLLPLALVAIFMFSCNEDDDVVTSPTPTVIVPSTAGEWFPLAVGNYWIFQQYNKDSLGVVSYITGSDSMYIDGQIDIDGISYFTLKGDGLNTNGDSLLRATDEFILNSSGINRFSLDPDDPFLSTEEHSVYTGESYMVNDTLVNFEIGLLNAKYVRQDITWKDGFSDCTLPVLHFYGKGIGPVRREYFFSNQCEIFGLELIRYHVE